MPPNKSPRPCSRGTVERTRGLAQAHCPARALVAPRTKGCCALRSADARPIRCHCGRRFVRDLLTDVPETSEGSGVHSAFASDERSTQAAASWNPFPGSCHGRHPRDAPPPWAFISRPPLRMPPEAHGLTSEPGTAVRLARPRPSASHDTSASTTQTRP